MQNDPSSNNQQNTGERLTPKELFKRHVTDPNHHVTDEELRNLKVGADAEDGEEVNKETADMKEEIDTIPDNDALPNPYPVLR